MSVCADDTVQYMHLKCRHSATENDDCVCVWVREKSNIFYFCTVKGESNFQIRLDHCNSMALYSATILSEELGISSTEKYFV